MDAAPAQPAVERAKSAARAAPARTESPKQPAPSRTEPSPAPPKRIDAAEAAPVLHPQFANRLELLERRIERLARAMDSIDARLARVEGRGRAAEEGVASIYREVQGLELDSPNIALKRQLMAAIFEANLALRARNAG